MPADKLAFACTPHHHLIEKGWRAKKLPYGGTEWVPPPHLDRGQRTNDYHHPKRL